MSSHYKYAMLRYSHNVTSGESLNVGVVMYSWEQRYLKAHFTTKGTRLKSAFRDFEIGYYREMANFLNAAFESRAASLDQLVNDRGQEHTASMSLLLESILPQDDSALQWSEVRGGIGEDLDAVFERLYQLYVGRYEATSTEERRDDSSIWRIARQGLGGSKIEAKLQPQTVKSAKTGAELTFEHTYRNGAVHCYLPLSLDLRTSEGIERKASIWSGRLHNIADNAKELKIYYLVGGASDTRLKKAQTIAENCLLNVEVERELIREDAFHDWSRSVAQMVEAH